MRAWAIGGCRGGSKNEKSLNEVFECPLGHELRQARCQASLPQESARGWIERYMEEAVLAFVDYKYAPERGTFRDGGAVTGWRDGATAPGRLTRRRRAFEKQISYLRLDATFAY